MNYYWPVTLILFITLAESFFWGHTNRLLSFPVSTTSKSCAIKGNEGKERQNYAPEERLSDMDSLGDGVRYFVEYAKRGIKRFQTGDIEGCIADFDRAAAANSTQPLQQRGIVLYCIGRYEEAARQLEEDLKKIEHMKIYKAAEIRIWLCACYYKLGNTKAGVDILDADHKLSLPVHTQSAAMNQTLDFFSGKMALEDMLEIIGSDTDPKDTYGTRYYGNFYLGLYFDAVGEPGLSQAFLSIPNRSARYSQRDMWYHLPRFFYAQRFGTAGDDDDDDDDDDVDEKDREEDDDDDHRTDPPFSTVNNAGMIIT